MTLFVSFRARLLARAAAGALILAAGPVLSGCSGVVKNLNSAQVNVPNVQIANPFGLDKQAAKVAVSNPNAAAHLALKPHDGTASNVNTFTFANQNPISLADVKSAQVSFNMVPKVTLDGTGLPTKFTLSTFTLDGTVSDTDGSGTVRTVALTQVATSGPVSFTQQPDGSYSADAGTFQLAQQTKTTDQQLQSLLDIATGGPTPNTATLTLNATSPDLPNGTVMHLTFDTTTLTISASQ